MKRMIMGAVVLLALIPTILIGYAANYYVQTTVETEKLDELTGITHMMDVHLTGYYDRVIAEIQLKTEKDELRSVLVEAGEPSGSNPVDRDEVENILLEPIGFPLIGGSIINPDGKIVLSSQPDEEGLLLNKTELFQSIMGGKDSYNGMVTLDDNTDVFEIAVPIRDGQGETIGILKQNADLDILSAYLGSLSHGKSGNAFLIRKNGFMIFGEGQENKGILYREYQNNNSLEQLVSDFKTDRMKEDKGIVTFENKGNECIGTYERIESIDCIAVTSVNRNEMFGSMMKWKAAFSVIILVLLCMIAAGGYLIGHLHAAPLKMMNDTLRRIASGDMTARCRFKGCHEFEELSRNINNLAASYQKNERELRMSSRIDILTHLPNQYAIYELLDTLLYKHPKQALLLLDLDGFKDVNDNLGYDIGDRILMEVGDILRELPQHVCYPSRLGGAEFLVFITNWTAPKYPEKIAEKIINKIEGIRFIDEVHVDISASIGIEYTEDEKIDKRKLIKHSNIAMHKARSNGRNSYFVHYPYMQKEI